MGITWLDVMAVLGAGLVAGFVNTMAGGGSFITLVALDMVGLSAATANGTNRIAVEMQNIMAVLGFKSKGMSNGKLSLHFALPALLGAILGARLVIELPEATFHRILAIAMLLMLAVLIVNPKRWLREREVEMTWGRRLVAYATFFAIGIYGGAIQAGVGFLLIAALVAVGGMNLVRCNSHKVFIVGVYTLAAIAMFAINGHIHLGYGVLLGLTQGVGAWIASRLSVDKGEKVVRPVLMLMLVVMAVRYLGIIPGF
ncbi:MAG: sulfite exporter TauE/SafE family protein [Anaerolineae bacterium]